MLDRRSLSFPALRAFEATAKHLHMGRAADELALTHAAVSHQVRLLEERLGVTLFYRTGKGLLLTVAGHRLKSAVTEGLDRIIDGARYLDTETMSGSLIIGCTETIASSWATKHIIEFSQAYPSITLSVRSVLSGQKIIAGDIDVAICYGAPDQGNRKLTRLGAPQLYPVCSPTLLSGAPSPLRIPDISQFTLIHDGQVDWKSWLNEYDVNPASIEKNIYFPSTSQALRASVLGGGVTLSNSLESRDFIRDGQLIQLFNKPVSEEHNYWLLAPEERDQTMKTQLFEEWVINALDAK